jgi:hypothetical protein
MFELVQLLGSHRFHVLSMPMPGVLKAALLVKSGAMIVERSPGAKREPST